MIEMFTLQALFPLRELGVALAHEIIKAKVGSPRMELLSKIFIASPMSVKIDCRVELAECRKAIRNQTFATIR